MTDRYMIIFIGSPYEFVLKDTMEKRTYGMFSNEQEKTMRRLCDDMNALYRENQTLRKENKELKVMMKNFLELRDDDEFIKEVAVGERLLE